MSANAPIDRLIALGPLKVWSIVVTIMGDLCRSPGDRIGGPLLTRLVAPMGITNQALRVALHRLKRDGWIEAERDGRVSSYALTPEGRLRTEAVRPVVYPSMPPEPGPVYVALPAPGLSTQDFGDMLPEEAAFAHTRAAIVAGPLEELSRELLVAEVDRDRVPDWICDVIVAPEALADYTALAETVETLGTPPDDLLEATVRRLLAFHHWRRLRLRHGVLPDRLLGPDWPGARARAATTAFLERHPRPSIDDLMAAIEAQATS
ncbi:hypothetical protein GQE99_07150 [Maritimibacter sp. DP07]|uniref:Transcriptional regulator, PaaX family n=1 Tax=Maritimibacter harenae TaxID=2606218 RepID=A0A845LYE0_9RHOB|nr:PaaX family transcriptional regulator C-terminal domain-containing protein [Maritimibacter harenae]MZR12795.1 hypothetical protein [Maritimibacter harenae]